MDMFTIACIVFGVGFAISVLSWWIDREWTRRRLQRQRERFSGTSPV